MNPFVFVMRRPLTTLMIVGAIVGGGVFGLNKMRADSYPPQKTPKIYVFLDNVSATAQRTRNYVVEHYESYFHKLHKEEAHHEQHKILVTSPLAKNVIIKQEYVCQIHSQLQSEVQSLESGYIEAIPIKEGQAVKKGDLMFKIVPVLFQARLDAEIAEAQLAQLEFNNTQRLLEKKVVSPNEVALLGAKLARAQAKQKLAEAELNFATIKAPFDGIVDRLLKQQGSLVKEGDGLTTLFDNSVMWVYFNVPEKRYLEYMADLNRNEESPEIELRLANLNKYPHMGKIDPAHNIGAIEAKFNNETGNIAFRADFPNPNRLLRHGQTGSVIISRDVQNAIVIPQRATYEILAKRFVFVVDKDDMVHQREIVVQYELEDIYVIEKGVEVTDKIVFEGIRQVHDGEKVEFEYRKPEEVMKDQKNVAE